MRESVNTEKAAPGSLKATLNPGAARNRKPKAELLRNLGNSRVFAGSFVVGTANRVRKYAYKETVNLTKAVEKEVR